MNLVGFTIETVLFVYCLQVLILVLNSGTNILTFQRTQLLSPFRVKVFSLFYPEDLGSWFLQKCANFY